MVFWRAGFHARNWGKRHDLEGGEGPKPCISNEIGAWSEIAMSWMSVSEVLVSRVELHNR